MAKCGWKENGTNMRPWLIAAKFAACLALCGAAPAQDNVIRVNVNLVRVLATVKNPAGELVGTLAKEDFTILDNGVPQQIAVFEHHSEQPLSIMMLVDTSGSTAKDLKFEIDSVTRFLHALFAEGNREDMVALYSFNYEVVQQNYFTHSAASIERSLRTLKGEAGTSLYDAIYLAARELGNREGRKVILIVTDGGDTTSRKDFKTAVEYAQLADAVIYPILVMPITNDAGRNIGGENALTTMAQWTGGKVFPVSLGPTLDQAFADIIKELRTQYLLGFYPKDVPLTKERFHRLEVRTRRPDLRVSARNGYYGESEGSSSSDSRISVVPQPNAGRTKNDSQTRRKEQFAGSRNDF
jgi:Ca-activated chloride channel family protein